MSEKLYYSMGEVAEMFDVNQSLLRHWESQFPILRPKRNKKGNRLFTPQDVEHLKQIYHLVKECGMTLEGAKRAMRGQRAGKGVSRDVELMERLQRIRALLVEVREELKGDGESVMADADAADTAADSGLLVAPACRPGLCCRPGPPPNRMLSPNPRLNLPPNPGLDPPPSRRLNLLPDRSRRLPPARRPKWLPCRLSNPFPDRLRRLLPDRRL